jgi:hypothetical protein
MTKNWKSERERKLKKIIKSLDNVGNGLYKAQVEVKMNPWRNTWELTGMMMERQEEIISLLGDIKVLLERSSRPEQKKKAGPDKSRMKKKIDSANYNDIRKMCKSVGITASGKKDELKNKLYKHYKLR